MRIKYYLIALLFLSLAYADTEKYYIRSILYVYKSKIVQQTYIEANTYNNIVNSRKFIRKFTDKKQFYQSICEIELDGKKSVPQDVNARDLESHVEIKFVYSINRVPQKLKIYWHLFGKDFQSRWQDGNWNLKKMNLEINASLDQKINPHDIYILLKPMGGTPVEYTLTKQIATFVWKPKNDNALLPLLVKMEVVQYFSYKMIIVSVLLFVGAMLIFPKKEIIVLTVLLCVFFHGLYFVEKKLPIEISQRQKQQIFKRLHENIYTVFDFKDKEIIYDILAQSIHGKALEQTYLEIYRSMLLEKEKTFIIENIMSSNTNVWTQNLSKFVVHHKWSVNGWVIHMGHKHLRKNEYEARYTVEMVENFWRITDCQTILQTRIE